MRIRTSVREWKCQARVLMMEKHGFLALVTFLVSMLYFLASYILNSAFPAVGGTINFALGLLGSLLINIVYYLFCAGQAAVYLNLCRGQQMRLWQLTAPFSVHPESVAVFAAFQFVIQTASMNLALWILPNIISENELTNRLAMYGALLALLVVTVWLELGLSMVFFLYCDNPQKSGAQLIRESMRLMRGKRGRMLWLMLSFLGVMLLGVLSAGIGLLFARPYLNTTQALFYLDLIKETRGEQNSAEADAFV